MLFWLFLSGPFLFVIISIFIGSLEPNYNQARLAISTLVNKRNGTWQTLNFLATGLLTLLLAYSLRNSATNNFSGDNFLLVAIWSLAITLIILGIFKTDKPRQKTIIGMIHVLVFIVGVLLQASLQLLLAEKNSRSNISTYLTISSLITLVLLPAVYYIKKYSGIVQRLLVTLIAAWITVAGLILHG